MLEPETGGFRFMDLPPELRALVYSFILEDDKPMKMTTRKRPNQPRCPVRIELLSRSYRKKKAVTEEDQSLGIVSLVSHLTRCQNRRLLAILTLSVSS